MVEALVRAIISGNGLQKEALQQLLELLGIGRDRKRTLFVVFELASSAILLHQAHNTRRMLGRDIVPVGQGELIDPIALASVAAGVRRKIVFDVVRLANLESRTVQIAKIALQLGPVLIVGREDVIHLHVLYALNGLAAIGADAIVGLIERIAKGRLALFLLMIGSFCNGITMEPLSICIVCTKLSS